MRWEMVFASRVLSGEKVLGSFREYQDPHQETEDRTDGESTALLRQCVGISLFFLTAVQVESGCCATDQGQMPGT